MKNLWNALHYDATIVFVRDSESQLFESQERPAVHAVAWSTLDSTQNHCRTQSIHFFWSNQTSRWGSKNNDDVLSFTYCNLLQDHRHLMIGSVGQWIRRRINVREISAKEPMLSPNKNYHHKYCIFLKTLVIQTNLMVVNKELWFYGHIIVPYK